MLFPTFDFLLFIIPALLGFWLLADKPTARMVWLLVASYFFYMAGPKTEPPPAPAYFAALLVFSTLLDFVCGGQIHKLAGDMDSDDAIVVRRAFFAAAAPARRKAAASGSAPRPTSSRRPASVSATSVWPTST